MQMEDISYELSQLFEKVVRRFSLKSRTIDQIIAEMELSLREKGLSTQTRYCVNLKSIVIGDWMKQRSLNLDPDFCFVTATPIQRIKAALLTISMEENNGTLS